MKHTQRFLIFTVILSALLFRAETWAASYFVASDGKDTHPGTIDRPFATLERARDAIRELKATDHLPEEGVTVEIREGRFALTHTLELDERDSGSAGNPVVYRAYQEERVSIHGGKILDRRYLRPVNNEAALNRIISEPARRKVMQINLKDLGITDYGRQSRYGHHHRISPAPMELFFENESMILARYPNEGTIKIGDVLDPGSLGDVGNDSNRGAVFRYTDDRHALWVGAEDLWFRGNFRYGYSDDYIPVADIDIEAGLVTLAAAHKHGVASGKDYRAYVAMNLLEELDMPGEFYIDRESGILYFWPPETKGPGELSVSLLEGPIIAFKAASYISIQGLTLELSRGTGLRLEGGRFVSINGCTVRNVGNIAISIGTETEGTGFHHRVRSCDLYNTGSGGVVLNGGDRRLLVNGDCSVENCRIWNYQRRDQFVRSAVNIHGCGNRIAHNEIFDADYHAIVLTGNEHVIEYNDIHHVALNADDVAAFYMGRNPSEQGNILRYNHFHDIGRADRGLSAIYLDDCTAGTVVFGNVFSRVTPAPTFGVVVINSGRHNTIENNLFIDCDGPSVYLNSMWDRIKMRPQIPLFFGDDGIFTRRLTREVDITVPPYSERYPELRNWLDPVRDGEKVVGMYPEGNVFRRNAFYRRSPQLLLQGEHAMIDSESNVELAEPGFWDEENGDYEFRKDSAVYSLIPGFEPIPFGKIGLYNDAFRMDSADRTLGRRQEQSSSVIYASDGRIGIMNADGSGERFLRFEVVGQETWHLGPMFSDGRRVILTSMEKQPVYGPDKPFGDYYIKTPSRMWIYDLDADRLEKEIMTEGRLAPLCFPQMLVPGEERMIVQVLTRHSDIGKIFNMNLDGSDAQPFTRKGEGFPYVFDASLDGKRTTFHVGGPDPHGYRIFTRDMDGGNPILVAGELGRFYFGPSYSPDGEWIVYAGRDAGEHGEASDWADVCIGRPDGSEQRVLTSGYPFWFSPSYGNSEVKGSGSNLIKWTPDGALLYTRKQPGSVNPWEFQDPRDDTDHFNREWDPSRARGGTFISRLDPRTGEEVALTPAVDGQWDLRAVPSPDGSQIAFLRAQVGKMPSLWVMEADGSNPRKLTDGFGQFGADHPRWVPSRKNR